MNTPGTFKDIRHAHTKAFARIALAVFVSIFFISLTSSCIPKRNILPEPVSSVKTAAAEAFYEKENQEREANWRNNFVQIVGEDILLPETQPGSGGIEATDYHFYIYAYNPQHAELNARDLLAQKILRVDVVGATARLDFPKAIPETLQTKDITGDAFASGNVIKLTVSSKTTKVVANQSGGAGAAETLRPFSIIAWFPFEFNKLKSGVNSSSKNSKGWYARKDVKVFYGDIRTRVQVISDTEARSVFGSEFSRYFYIGRVFLRNRSSTNALAVYTTSMRVPTLFFRQSTDTGQLSMAAAKALKEEALLFHPGSGQPLATKLEIAKRIAEKFIADYPQPFGASDKRDKETLTLQLQQHILDIWAQNPPSGPGLLTTLLGASYMEQFNAALLNASPLGKASSAKEIREWVTKHVKENKLPSTILGQNHKEALIDALVRLAETRLNKRFSDAEQNGDLVTAITYESSEGNSSASQKTSLVLRQKSTDDQIPGPRPESRAEGSSSILAFNKILETGLDKVDRNILAEAGAARIRTLIQAEADAAEKSREAADQKLKSLCEQARFLFSSSKPGSDAAANAKREELLVFFDKLAHTPTVLELARNRDLVLGKLKSLVIGDDLRAKLQAIAQELYEVSIAEFKYAALNKSLTKGQIPDEEMQSFVGERIQNLRMQVLDISEIGTPFDQPGSIPVNTTQVPLAFSNNTRKQQQLLELGYMWRDFYRPMTFQAVLNALIFAHEQDPRTVTVEWLEALAKVAGGAIGLSSIVEEFGRRGYAQSVSVFSSVILPVVRERIVEDLKKHITNLGQMSMDTVVVIPPNESYDRYVFFPRGPIYNFPDELDTLSPAYIARIEGEELFVEAVPVEPGKTLRGGAMQDASTLTAQALNEGEKSAQARLLDQAALQSKLRTIELSHLQDRIESLLQTLPAKDAPEYAARKLAVENQVRSETAKFSAYFGSDGSGSLSYLLAKYNIPVLDAAPMLQPVPTVKLLRGTTSVPVTIPCSDDVTPTEKLTLGIPTLEPKDDTQGALSGKRVDPQDKLNIVLTEAAAKNPAEQIAASLRNPVSVEVKDQSGNIAKVSIPVELQPIVFEWDLGTLGAKTDNALRLGPSNELSFRLVVKHYDSDPGLLNLDCALDEKTNEAVGKFAKPTVKVVQTSSSLKRLELEVTIDGSKAPQDLETETGTQEFTLIAKLKTGEKAPFRELAKDELKLVLNAKKKPASTSP